MGRLLANLSVDGRSFWFGFLAGTLFWALILILRPVISRLFAKIRDKSKALRQEIRTGVDIRLSNDTLNYIQGLHLASPLFSLDELVIEPRLLSPPPQTEPGVAPTPGDIMADIIPYTPDWPELATLYGAATITLPEALQNASRLVIMGRSGSGKSIALALLASRIIRNVEMPGDLNQKTPIFIHAGAIVLPERNPENLLETIFDAISSYASSLTLPRLLPQLEKCFQSGQALLLIDGLDEFPNEYVVEIVRFLGKLLSLYPETYVVATSSLDYYDGLTQLDFAPVAMAAWDENQRASFIRNWSNLWLKYVGPNYSDAETIDPLLLNAWLLKDDTPLSPLELTLKVWAAYAEDTLGHKPTHSIEAYLRRMSLDIPYARVALERLAIGILTDRKPIFTPDDAKTWLAGLDKSKDISDLEFSDSDATKMDEPESADIPGAIPVSRVLPALSESGILIKHQGDRLSIIHPQILNYLAGAGLLDVGIALNLIEENLWSSIKGALGYFVTRKPADDLVKAFVQKSRFPRMDHLLTAASWIRNAPSNANWRNDVLRKIISLLRAEDMPLSIRTRAGIALALSNVPNLDTLFKQLCTSKSPELRSIAVASSGLLRDENLIDTLTELTQDISMDVSRAACLALVAIGNQTALENIADILLHGSEDLRRAAAEALANHPEEGHPTLREGATLDDILVRRAVIFGLRRIKQLWAFEVLETMQIEDPQWAVQNVAASALEEIRQPNPHLPRSFTPLPETPWLISFAGERGVGVSPGKPAHNLILQSIREGSLEQQLAGLDYLLRHAQEDDLLPIYQLMKTIEGEVRDAAYNVLWHLDACGYKIPEIPIE